MSMNWTLIESNGNVPSSLSYIIIHTTEPTIASEIFVQTIGDTTPYYEFFIQNNAGDYLKVIPQLLKDKSYKFKTYPKKKIVSDFPIYLLIEPISACNLRCIMCFQIDDSFSSDKDFMGRMDLELFKKVLS